MNDNAKLSTRVLIAFACVYVFWGSTFLAIRTGVAFVPPFTMGAARFLVAGSVVLAVCGLRGMRLRQSGREFALQLLVGVLVLGLGNTGVAWAEQSLPSGFVSLLVAIVPVYIALLEAVLPGGEGLRTKGWAGIGLGFIGMLVLISPQLRSGLHGHGGQLGAVVIAISAPLAWSVGSITSRRAKFTTNAFVSAGWQMLFAGGFNLLMVPWLNGGRAAVWNRQGVLSIAYLIVFGSFVGYVAYIYLLEHVPVAKVSTYAYVNPVVAVLLGAVLLHERLEPVEVAGMAFILVAVYLVTSSKLKRAVPAKVVA